MTRGSGCPSDDEVAAIFDGRSGESHNTPEDHALEDHLDTCTACRSLWASLIRGTPATDAQRWLRPGAVVDRYVVRAVLGSGGMGVVYAADDPDLDRKVALKLIRPALGEQHVDAARSRLRREAQALARVAHDNVVAVYDVGNVGADVFVAMEHVQGRTLRAWLGDERSTRGWRGVLAVLARAGAGLAAAHAAGIVHRDFKPDNVLLADSGRVLVGDFGLAKLTRGDEERTAPRGDGEDPTTAAGDDVLHTPAGARVGTPGYVAPEVHVGRDADERSDQWSFCVVALEALFGARPPARDLTSGAALPWAGAQRRGGDACARAVPAWVVDVLVRGVDPDPRARHASMHELLQRMDVQRRRRRAVVHAAGAGGAVLLGAIGVLTPLALQRGPRCDGSPELVAAVWDEAQRAGVMQAFAASGRPGVHETARRVLQRLDDYAADIVSIRAGACRETFILGTRSPELLDLVDRCLDDRTAALGAFVAALQEASPADVDAAAQAAMSLPWSDECVAGNALPLYAAPPAAVADAVHDIESRTELLEVNQLLDRLDVMRDEAERMAADADATGFPPIIARTYAVLAETRSRDRDPLGAVAAAERAQLAALSIDARDLAGVLARLIGEERRDELHQLDAAHESFELGRALLTQSERIELLAQLDISEATVFWREGRPDQALAIAEPAVARLERAAGEHELLLANGLDVLAVLKNPAYSVRAQSVNDAAQSFAAARALHERALALRRKTLPDDADVITTSLSHLANVACPEGRLDDCLELSHQVSGRLRASFGEGHRDTAEAEVNEAFTLLQLERPDEALALLDHAAPALAPDPRIEDPDALRVQLPRAQALRKLGRLNEAWTTLTQLQAAWRQSWGDDAYDVVELDFELGEVARKQGRLGKAREHYERAVRESERIGSDFLAGIALASWGALELDANQPARAVRLLERALALQMRTGTDPVLTATNQADLGRALHDTGGDRDRVRALIDAARAPLRDGGVRAQQAYTRLLALERALR